MFFRGHVPGKNTVTRRFFAKNRRNRPAGRSQTVEKKPAKRFFDSLKPPLDRGGVSNFLRISAPAAFCKHSYPRWTRANTVFRGGNRAQLRFPHCRATARLLRQPPRTRFPLPKNSEGLSGEQKSGLARKRTTVGWRPPRTMTMSSADFLPLESVFALVHRGYVFFGISLLSRSVFHISLDPMIDSLRGPRFAVRWAFLRQSACFSAGKCFSNAVLRNS